MLYLSSVEYGLGRRAQNKKNYTKVFYISEFSISWSLQLSFLK